MSRPYDGRPQALKQRSEGRGFPVLPGDRRLTENPAEQVHADVTFVWIGYSNPLGSSDHEGVSSLLVRPGEAEEAEPPEQVRARQPGASGLDFRLQAARRSPRA